MVYNMNKTRLIKSLFIVVIMLQFLSCSSDKNDEVLQPDGNNNRRYLSVRNLEFSSSTVDFAEQSKGSKTVKSFSVSNNEKNYPIKFSIDNIPNNITVLDTSTCAKDNATVYPGEGCIYSILLANNEVGDQLDNITFYDNYSEVYLGVSSNVVTRSVRTTGRNTQSATSRGASVRDVTAQNITVQSATARGATARDVTAQSATARDASARDASARDASARGASAISNTGTNVELSKTSTTGINAYSSNTQNIDLSDSNIQGVTSVNFPLIISKEYHSYGKVDRALNGVLTDFVISNSSSAEVSFDISPLTSGGYIIHPISTCKTGVNKLSSGQNCFISMVFSPTSSTIYNDSFDVSYRGEKISVSLTGVGAKRYTDINSLKLSKDIINYGTVTNGEYKVYSVTVKNNSNDSFMKFSLGNIEDGFSYLPSSTCGVYFTTLPPSQSCELSVKYLSSPKDKTVNIKVGTVNLWVNNLFKEIKFLSNSTDKNILSIDQSIIDFDNILVKSINSNMFTLNNNSDLAQSIRITSSDDITINNAPTSIQAGSSMKVDFSLQPKNIDRDYRGNIKVTTSDGSDYILPVKAEVVSKSNIDVTQFLSSASIGEKVYMYDDNMLVYNPLIDNKSNQLYSYNLSSTTWNKIEYTGDVPKYGIGAELLFFDDAFYLFGGADKDSNLSNNLLYFDTISKKWSSIVIDNGDIKPTARKGYKGVVAKEKLYIMGGVDSNGNQLDEIWSYDLSRRSKGFDKVNINHSFTATEINDASTILMSDNDNLYIVVANKVYSYRIGGELKWKEEYSVAGIDLLKNINAVIDNKVLYLIGNKIGNDKLFLSKLNMITGQTVEIETNVAIKGGFKSVLQLNSDGFIYLFLMFDDKVSNELYYLNDISGMFVEIDTKIYTNIEKIDASVLYKEYIYSLGSDNKLYNYNLNSKRFEYKSLINCANILTTVTPHLISDSNRNKLYVVDGSNNMCEYDIELGSWVKKGVGTSTGVQDNFSVAIYGNHLWLYGGMKSDKTVSDELWKYDIDGSSGWIKVTKSLSSTTSIYGVYDHKMVVYGDALYIVGGYLDTLSRKNNSIFKIDLSEGLVSIKTVSTLDIEKQLSDNFGIALYKSGFVLLGLNDIKNNILYYNVEDNDFTIYSSIGGDYFDKEYVSKVISFGSALYLQNNIYQRVSKIILE